MTPDPTLVEQIVAAVERRLRDEPCELADRPAEAGEVEGEIVCAESVVTGEMLSQRLTPRSRHLRISVASILTPSAREVVARHELSVTVDADRGQPTATTGLPGGAAWRLLLADADVTDLRGLVSERSEGTDASVVRVCALLSEAAGSGAVVLSTNPHRLACLANRHHQVRAVVVGDAREATRLLRRLGANVVVACPLAAGAWQSRQIAETCLAADPPLPPSDWPS